MDQILTNNRIICFTAKELMERDIPELQWIVPGLIPTGLIMLGGPAKTGKSVLVFDLAVAVALGLPVFGKIQVEKSGVLYISLEDTEARLQDRLSTLLQGKIAPDNLHFYLEWPKFDVDGLEKLDSWLTAHPDVKLVIVDVYAKIKKPMSGRNWYEQDYQDLSSVKKLAEKHSAAIILVVHLNKSKDCEDPFHAITGSTAMSGAPDTLLLFKSNLQKTTGKLLITGRDVESNELSFKSDKAKKLWILNDDSEEYQMSGQRAAIIDMLKNSDRPLKIRDIAKELDKNENSVRQLLFKLHRDGDIVKCDRGLYSSINDNKNNNNTDNNGNKLIVIDGMAGQ